MSSSTNPAPVDEEEFPIPEIGPDNRVLCPKCKTYINLGTVGIANLTERHWKSAKCDKNRRKHKEMEVVEKTKAAAKTFFMLRPPKVPPTVSAPPRVQSNPLGPLALPGPSNSSNLTSKLTNTLPSIICPLAIAHLQKLRSRIETLDERVEEAGPDHPLAGFSGDPAGFVLEGEDAWEKWDGPLNTILQKEPAEIRKLVSQGEKGLIALHGFLHYLVLNHGIKGGLIEGKIDRLIVAIDEVLVICLMSMIETDLPTVRLTSQPAPTTTVSKAINTSGRCSDIEVEGSDVQGAVDLPINVDTLPDVVNFPSPRGQLGKVMPITCVGVHVKIPPGKSIHTLYPFGLHEQYGDSWDYEVIGGQLTLRARNCLKSVSGKDSRCKECDLLTDNAKLFGILDRMQKGVHKNAPYAFHGVGGLVTIAREKTNQINVLRLRKLNDARKIIAKSGALSNHKEWIMAIGSGKVERVERLVKAAIAQKRGIRALLKMHNDAAQTVYRTRTFTEEDQLRGRLLWRLGGARVADIGFKSLALPSLRTLRKMDLMPALIASPSHPSPSEVEANTVASTTMISEILKSAKVVHQVLMLDEIKVEERPRWDDRTNNILGLCREHGRNASLHYTSKQEADLLLQKVLDGEVHLATNVR